MDRETRRPGEVLSQYVKDAVNPDLTPMLELTLADCFRIVNRLTNLVHGAVLYLRDTGQRSIAAELAGRAADILVGYDPELAQILQRRWGLSAPEGLADDRTTPYAETPPRR
jgi:hypothetical protein